MYSKTSGPKVFVDGQWIDKNIYRAYVYKKGERSIANNWQEYQDMLAKGWYESKELADKAAKGKRSAKKKDLSDESNG